ncbi:hypothetical protein HAX54_007701 [Datura stramonium]|uniref:Uncharacterized protein n=1 Tax=Datura stramonium TaxID=4076 RepID=A0ABS8TE25_DATST|nr:hypothetical protein [Datura stramonium]
MGGTTYYRQNFDFFSMGEEMLTFNEMCLWRSMKDTQDTNTLRNVNNCLLFVELCRLGFCIGSCIANQLFVNLPGDSPAGLPLLRGTFSALEEIGALAALHELLSVVRRFIRIFILKS